MRATCVDNRHAALVHRKVDVLVLKMKKIIILYFHIESQLDGVNYSTWAIENCWLWPACACALCSRLLNSDCPIESVSMCVVFARNVKRNNFFSSRCLGHYLSTTHTHTSAAILKWITTNRSEWARCIKRRSLLILEALERWIHIWLRLVCCTRAVQQHNFHSAYGPLRYSLVAEVVSLLQ